MDKCPKCDSQKIVKSGVVQQRQRFKCKSCNYHFTVNKEGKKIETYFVMKALQLYLEGLSYREIERILGVSHVSVMNWVREYKLKRPKKLDHYPNYKILKLEELADYISQTENVKGKGLIISEVGDKFMIIKWDRFRD